jgi:hypothetical protein
MQNVYLLSAAAGLISGMAMSAATTPGLGLLAALLGGLPVFIVGLSWSWAAALLAAAIGALYAHLLGPDDAGMNYVIRFALPAVLGSLVAGLSLTQQSADGSHRLQWASPGFLIVVMALAAGCATLWFMSDRFSADWAQLRETATKISMPPEAQNNPEIEAQARKLIDELWDALLPASIAATMLAQWLLNLWMAGRIANAMGRLQRPWPQLSLLTFPPGSALILVAGLGGASLATGVADTIATGIAGAFFLAYLLLGLAVIHHLTRGKAWRVFALSCIYFGLLALHILLAVPIILLGLLDSIWPLRRRAAGGGTT